LLACLGEDSFFAIQVGEEPKVDAERFGKLFGGGDGNGESADVFLVELAGASVAQPPLRAECGAFVAGLPEGVASACLCIGFSYFSAMLTPRFLSVRFAN
jgi:hypothetical protein